MTIKKLGYGLVVLGGIIIVFSFLVDLIGVGDDGIQAAQLLGIQIGAILLLAGTGLLLAKGNRNIDITVDLNAWALKVINYPVIVWVLLTFVTLYFLFFVSYAFLNPELQMRYITRYLPEGGRIGMDIRAIMSYIEDWLVLGQSPYTTGFIAYPPLTLILFAPLLLIGYPAYFNLITIITLISYAIATLVVPMAISKSKSIAVIVLMFVAGLFSYGFQFELERGQSNMLAFALSMASIYLFHAHPRLRFFSYILFSLAVQLKIYPAIFIIMMIDQWRDWKTNFIRLAGIGLANFVLLFVLGFDLFQDFLTVTMSQQSQLATWNGVSIRSFVFVLSSTGYSFFSESIISAAGQYPQVFELFFLALFLICLVALIVLAFIRQKNGFNPYLLVACTIGALIIPTISNDYKLPLLIGPVSILLSAWPVMENISKKVISFILLNVVLLAFWSTLYPFRIKPEILHNGMPVLLVIVISITLINLLSDKNQNLRSVAVSEEENKAGFQSA